MRLWGRNIRVPIFSKPVPPLAVTLTMDADKVNEALVHCVAERGRVCGHAIQSDGQEGAARQRLLLTAGKVRTSAIRNESPGPDLAKL